MPSWKRVIVSGSDAALNSLLVTNGVTITGSLNTTGSANINGQLSASSGHFATRAQIGELGTEQSSVKINGLTFNSNLKVSDLSNSNAAQTILHKHSTTAAPIVVGARSNSDTISHGAVVNDMPTLSIYGAGWTSGTYSLNGQINIGTDDTGTISGTSSPGKIEFWTTPNGTIWPEMVMKIDSNKKLTVSGSVQAISFTGSLQGTSSYATQALSSSFATTASYVNPLIQNVQLTGSLNVTNGNSIVDLANGSILGKVGNVDYFKVTGSSSTGGVVQIAHTNTTVVGQLTGNSGGAGNGLNLGFYNYLNLRTLNSSITITADVAPSWRVYSGTNFSFLGYSGYGDPNGGEVIMKDALTGNEAFHAYLGLNQRIIMSSSSLAINQTTPGAKLDIRTGGNLSTDLGLRVRNNANTADLFSVAGNGVATLSGSLNVTQGITGSLQGTSSYATQALSSSFATTAATASFLNGGTNGFIQNGNSFGTTATLGTNDNNSLQFETNNSTRMFISSSGNVGIGNTSPTSPLHIVKSGGARINLGDSQNTVAISSIEEVGDSAIGFYTQTTTERMRITSAGNVGIGTTAPTARLHISAPGALSSDIGFKVRNSANTADLFNVVGTGQVSVFNNSTNSSLSSMDPTNTFAAVTLENFSLVNTTFKKVLGIQSYANSGLRYLTMSSLDDLHWNHRFTVAGRLTTPAGISSTSTSNDFNSSTIANLYGVNLISQASISMRPDFNLALTENNLGLFIAPNNTANPTKKLIKLMDSTLTNTYFTVNGLGQVGIGTSSPTKTLQVIGTTSLSSSFDTAASGSTLSVYGSGSAQPVFTVQGSQGELFSVTDSLSGSLFSVNDISGLPIMEVFSDNTTLMGSYQAPSLNTTVKTTTIAGNNVIYSVPTASYNGAWFEYVATSASNARAGQIMSVCSSNTITYTETTTTDIGSTTGLNFMVMITGSNFALTGSSTTAGWTIKTIVRSI